MLVLSTNSQAYQLGTMIKQNFSHVCVSILTRIRQCRVTRLCVSMNVGIFTDTETHHKDINSNHSYSS